MWYRVFGSSEVEPPPPALLEFLQTLDPGIRGHFRGDDLGWFAVELRLPEGGIMTLERFLSTEDDIRAELNHWAAWVESNGEDVHRLMQQIISTKQVFTLRIEDEEADEALYVDLCRYLAGITEGVYQIDGQGFFDAAGGRLIAETP
jgi:hypothetical protein